MKTKPLYFLLAACMFLTTVFAQNPDTVVLTGGDRVEGTIVFDNEEQVLIEVTLTPTITERRSIQKSEITEIIRSSPEQIAFARIQTVRLPAISTNPETYDHVISQLLDPFLESFPAGAHAGAVRALKDAFAAERDRVLAGEIKLDGEWIPAGEVAGRRGEIESRHLLVRMEDSAASGDHPAVLNAFVQIEREFKGQNVYPDAVALAQNSVRILAAEIPRLVTNHQAELRQWQAGVELTPESRRQALIDAREAENAAFDAKLEAASAAGNRWPPMIPRSLKSLDALRAQLASEAARIMALDTAGPRSSVQFLRKAKTMAAAGEFDAAEELLREALGLWPENASALSLLSELPALAEAKREHLDQLKEQSAEEQPTEEQPTEEQPTEEQPTEEQPAEEQSAEEATAQEPKAGVDLSNETIPAVNESTPVSDEKPFFMTIRGAFSILIGVVIFVSLVSLASKAKRKLAKETRD